MDLLCMLAANPQYQLSGEDTLILRYKTSGIVEHDISYAGERYVYEHNKKTRSISLLTLPWCDIRLVDVGGPRSERKKWIHCFSHVDSIVFCYPVTGLVFLFILVSFPMCSN